MVFTGSYDPLIVALSVAVAIFASFTALNLAGRLIAADRSARFWWMSIAALALGGGIWSMHFIGMLAFQMPMAVSYSVDLTIISLFLPVLFTGLGLHIVGRRRASWRIFLLAGVFVGLGVATMHYTGMAGMRMPGVTISYDPVLVGISIAIAISAATAALWLAFRTTGTRQRICAAVVMGLAISGMHYTAMAAVRFTMTDPGMQHTFRAAIPSDVLAFTVAGATFVLLLLSLQAAHFDRKLARLSAREAEALKLSEKRYRSLIENASDIIAVLDHTGKFLYEGSSARHVLGHHTEHLIGRSFQDFVAPQSVRDVPTLLAALTAQSGQRTTAELSLLRRDGGERPFEVVGHNLLHEPSVQGVVINLRDITERKQLMAQLETLSETDALTGALNRRGFVKIVGRELHRQRRTGEPLSLIMIDIDLFKDVNDNHGHAAGDLVLAMVSQECRNQIRTADVLTRFGGDEFVVLLLNTPTQSAHETAERLRGAIAAASLSTAKSRISVTASLGLTTMTAAMPDLDAALREADEALYAAKKAGRNCIKVGANARGVGADRSSLGPLVAEVER